MKLTELELERLITYIKDGEKRIAEARRIVADNAVDFEVWYKYSNKSDRYDYPSLLGIQSKIRNFVDKHLGWLINKDFEGYRIDIDLIVESINVLLQEGEITTKEANEVKNEMMKINFNSMVVSW